MRNFILAAAAASAVAPSVRSQTLYHVNQAINPGEYLYVDLESGDFGTSYTDVPGFDLFLRFYKNDVEAPIVETPYGWMAAGPSAGSGHATRYSYGASLAFNNLNVHGRAWLDEDSVPGPWDGGTSAPGYLALKNTAANRVAWMGIIYDDTLNTYSLQSFAVAPDSFPLTAGAVPEPAETAAVMALLAGGAALYHRRRQQKTAASIA